MASIPCERLPHKEPGVAYLVLATPPEDGDCFETVSPLMKFTVKDCDPDTGEPDSDQGYDDEYQLEDLEITFGDFIQVKESIFEKWQNCRIFIRSNH